MKIRNKEDFVHEHLCDAYRLSPDALAAPAAVENLNRQVNDRIKREYFAISFANYAESRDPATTWTFLRRLTLTRRPKIALLIRSSAAPLPSFGPPHPGTVSWIWRATFGQLADVR